MSRHTITIPLRWGDMDAFGHVNNVVFLRLMEEARVQMIGRLSTDHGHQLDWMRDGILVARHEIDYLLPLEYSDATANITMWVTNIGGASFDVQYLIHTEDSLYPEQPRAHAETTLVVYDLAEKKIRRLSKKERSVLESWSDDRVLLKGQKKRAKDDS